MLSLFNDFVMSYVSYLFLDIYVYVSVCVSVCYYCLYFLQFNVANKR